MCFKNMQKWKLNKKKTKCIKCELKQNLEKKILKHSLNYIFFFDYWMGELNKSDFFSYIMGGIVFMIRISSNLP
jgi:hypothetical protein